MHRDERVTDEMVEKALSAFNKAINEPTMIKCDRCDGKGHHHGFGEDGHDPDWCTKCGGNQFDVAPGEEARAMRLALSAAYPEQLQPVAWQPRYKQEAIDHHRSQGADFWEYAMSVYPTKADAENYGHGGHEARPLFAHPPRSAALSEQTLPEVSVDLLDDVIDDIRVYRDHEPEEDESWESWYFAAFDLLITRVQETFMRHAAPRSALVDNSHASEAVVETWRPIETAPTDGTEILLYREDCGVILGRWIAPCEFLNESEYTTMDPDSWETSDWFGADFVAGYRITNDGDPTRWMPLPAPPALSSLRPAEVGSATSSSGTDDNCPGEHQEVLDAIQSHNSGEDE